MSSIERPVDLKECTYNNGFGCENSCFLIHQAEQQSQSGSYKDINNRIPGGPMWRKDEWDDFVNRIININGCAYPREVREEILYNITQKKIENNEFYTKENINS